MHLRVAVRSGLTVIQTNPRLQGLLSLHHEGHTIRTIVQRDLRPSHALVERALVGGRTIGHPQLPLPHKFSKPNEPLVVTKSPEESSSTHSLYGPENIPLKRVLSMRVHLVRPRLRRAILLRGHSVHIEVAPTPDVRSLRIMVTIRNPRPPKQLTGPGTHVRLEF